MPEIDTGLLKIFGEADLERKENGSGKDEPEYEGLNYVSHDQLSKALGTKGPGPLPSVEQMFKNVAKLLIGKPVEATA